LKTPKLLHCITKNSLPQAEKELSMMNMNLHPQMHVEDPLLTRTEMETTATDTGVLVEVGFSEEEILALLWLRQWYQSGGSDRSEVVRRLEFLKMLVQSGKLEA
jgi:hypothetical protein